MEWQPVPESLSQLAACLKDSLSGVDKAAQKQAENVRTPIVSRLVPCRPVSSYAFARSPCDKRYSFPDPESRLTPIPPYA
jgi:hypothetical protein